MSAEPKYSLERLWFDRWAAWREHAGHIGITRTKDSVIARLMQYGQRIGVAHYSAEPESDDIPQLVELFMQELRPVDSIIHACLEARHRRVVGTLNIGLKYDRGRMRNYTDTELAEIVLGDKTDMARKRFQRHCLEGYKRLAGFSRVTP